MVSAQVSNKIFEVSFIDIMKTVIRCLCSM